ncbi:ribbon-helix-helix protein, CopG family [Colwellia sp. MEBiC06753]
MSLTDLKKGQGKAVKKKKFTVDEFISDAENYAKGTPQLVKRGEQEAPNALNLDQAIAFAEKKVAEKEQSKESNRPFRHATFTLSEDAIAQLNELARESNLAKSHIIRILIEHLASQDQKQQLATLLGSKTI